ncbi:hydrolase [Thermogymnomonas acidicola]|uniref:Hydrolase n=1 Tax=Thermogymnomonas acidicola TaxID=399579 RepID=A0AA37BQJ3_9ARCH|nr:HIT family protein [Thermogymnomonas acidicola]GGM68038.1 hydrolase [Thermogymnomonas acidicola]
MSSFSVFQRSDCVFCRISKGEQEAAVILKEDGVVAFMDHAPVEPGHLLVVPEGHFENIFDIDMLAFLKVQSVAKKLARSAMVAMGADAVNIGQNNGPCANQVVMHYHLHVIPRWCDRQLQWGRRRVMLEELRETADKIREQLHRDWGDHVVEDIVLE